MNMFSRSGDHPQCLPESKLFTTNYYIYAGICFHCAPYEVTKHVKMPMFVEDIFHSCKYDSFLTFLRIKLSSSMKTNTAVSPKY